MQPYLTVGKYEGIFHMPDRDSVLSYWDACLNETVHSGFSPQKAQLIERENLLAHAKRYGRPAVNYVSQLLDQL